MHRYEQHRNAAPGPSLAIVEVTVDGVPYGARLVNDDGAKRVELHAAGEWAGAGGWMGRIVDAEAPLPEAAYVALETAILNVLLEAVGGWR